MARQGDRKERGGRSPRFHFLSGKGGVGKTTTATAFAIARAEEGLAVLLISTDPAHSLANALDAKVGPEPRRVKLNVGRAPGRRRARRGTASPRSGALHALELDADAALERWLDERRATLETIAERGTYLDKEDVAKFLRLSLPGVDELVGLLEVVRIGREEDVDLVVVDTAPTGHTLRLLEMPATLRKLATVFDDMQAKHRVVAASLGGSYRGDRSDALIDEIDAEGEALGELIRDPARVSFSWVLLPEELSVAETKDGLAALEAAGIAVGELVVNRVTPRPRGRCALCEGRVRAEARAVEALETTLPIRFVPAVEEEPRGVAALRKLAKLEAAPPIASSERSESRRRRPSTRPLPVEFTPSEERVEGPVAASLGDSTLRLLLFGGKGGTGKTTCAAATALAIARAEPGRRILLLSTDPAHSLGDVLEVELGDEPTRLARNLEARELDAVKAFDEKRELFRASVDELFDGLRGSSSFDDSYDRAVARDLIELAPPGIDELFAILSVMNALIPEHGDGGAPSLAYDLVVVDTAPSGHALRLLEMPASAQEWVKTLLQVILKYREVMGLGKLTQDLVDLSRGLRRLRATLEDGRLTRFVPVARAAALPRIETVRLLGRLEELGVAAPTVVVNALTPPGCARCERARAREKRELSKLERGAARGMLVAHATAPPPRGAKALEEWARTWQPR